MRHWFERPERLFGALDAIEDLFEVVPVTSKTCSRCRTRKPLADYSPAAERQSGVRPACLACEAAARRARYAARRDGVPAPTRSPGGATVIDLATRRKAAPVVPQAFPVPLPPAPAAVPAPLAPSGAFVAALAKVLEAADPTDRDAGSVATLTALAPLLDAASAAGDAGDMAKLLPRWRAALADLGLVRKPAAAAAPTAEALQRSKLDRFRAVMSDY